MTIERITIINDSPTTAANLNPAPNTLAGQGETEGASSGSSAPTLLMVLAGLAFGVVVRFNLNRLGILLD